METFFQRSKRHWRSQKSSQKGVALLLALFAMTLMTFIALEVSYDTSVDYVVAAQEVNRIKAYYAAKSGVELSLLRVMLYKQAVTSLGDSLGGATSMLDPIWSFPFMWPPTAAALGEKLNEVDKDMLKDSVKDSLMQAQSAATIQPEGGLIDVNDLGSPVKALKESMIQQVLKIFQNELEKNDAFRKKYDGYRFEELVNNIADYIDEDTTSLNGGDESAPYSDVNSTVLQLPPNRPLRTLDELHQVAGMKDDFYKILAPRMTVFGTKGININYASKSVLMALDSTMTEEAVNKVIERRTNPKIGGPFHDDKDFFGFIQGYGVNVKNIESSKVPLLYNMEFNFRITATGLASNVKREITVVTYDYPNMTDRFADMLTKQDDQDQGVAAANATNAGNSGNPSNSNATTAGNQANNQKKKLQAPKGRPTVVYWEEN